MQIFPALNLAGHATVNHVHVHDALWPIRVVFTQGIPSDAINVNCTFSVPNLCLLC